MPEGPQMYFLKEQLEPFIGGDVLSAEGSAKEIPFDSVKGKLIGIRTYGKEILFCFNDFTIRIHLMLFGKFAINSTLNRNLKLGFKFKDGEINFYACECRFITEPLDEVYAWKADVMNESFDPAEALNKLKKEKKQIIADALLEQHILAGVGNKIKNEVLFRHHVHPASIVEAIPEKQLDNLVKECRKLSFEYLEWKRKGEDDEHWDIYKKKDCPRDHVPLRKEKLGKQGRTSYFCEKCQELYVKDEG